MKILITLLFIAISAFSQTANVTTLNAGTVIQYPSAATYTTNWYENWDGTGSTGSQTADGQWAKGDWVTLPQQSTVIGLRMYMNGGSGTTTKIAIYKTSPATNCVANGSVAMTSVGWNEVTVATPTNLTAGTYLVLVNCDASSYFPIKAGAGTGWYDDQGSHAAFPLGTMYGEGTAEYILRVAVQAYY